MLIVLLCGCDEPRQSQPRQDEPRQDEPRQDEPRQDEPRQDEPASAAPNEILERGRYLAEVVMKCPVCHTARGEGPAEERRYAGGLRVWAPLSRWVTPNISQHVETGIGGWTDEEIIRAIRQGSRPDGKQLTQAFPYLEFTVLSDRDATALVTYLRTVPAIENDPPRAWLPALPYVPPEPRGEPPPDTPLGIGEYYYRISLCSHCHFNNGRGGLPVPVRPEGGHFQLSPNISPDPETGIAHYTEDDLVTLIRTGRKPDGTSVTGGMHFVGYSPGMQEEHARALAQYLKALPPARNAVPAELIPYNPAMTINNDWNYEGDWELEGDPMDLEAYRNYDAPDPRTLLPSWDPRAMRRRGPRVPEHSGEPLVEQP